MISLKSKRELDIIRRASSIVKEVLTELEKNIKSGVSTAALDQLADELIRKRGGVSAFKNYHGFPAHICCSLNEEVVHGIPSARELKSGDLVSIDVGVKYQGYHSDAARSWLVGKGSSEAARLIAVTQESFFRGIAAIKKSARLGDLSHAIQAYVEKNGFKVVRDFVGHGIGREMHEEPQIPNFGKPHTGPVLENGMTLAIEPMVNVGTWRVKILDNRWTVVTEDNSLSAHYENTVVILDDHVEVLT